MKTTNLLFILFFSFILSACGGGGDDDDSESTSTTYNSAASEGELLEYKIDETKLTYSYEIKSSAFGLEGSTGSGTLTKNPDGTYTPSSAINARVLMLPNKVLIGATTLRINGVDKFTLIAGVPEVDNVQFSDIAGTYNYVGLQCLSANCANYTSLYGTYNIDSSGNWVECTYSDYTASPSNCSGRDSGTLNSLDDGRFQIVSGGTNFGTGMFYHSPAGQKVMVVDLKDYFGGYGRGMLFGAPQRFATFGTEMDGNYYWNTSDGSNGGNGTIVVSGDTATFPGGSPNTMIANTPWNGFNEVLNGYGMLADEGIYMWVPKIGFGDTFMTIGVKEQ